MFRFLLLCFASIYAALPTVSVKHNWELKIEKARENERLLSFSIDNPDKARFRLRLDFANNCSLKHSRKNLSSAMLLSSIRWRFAETRFQEKDIWERNKSPEDCRYFYINFIKNEDIKAFYNLELLGSWGEGGNKLTAGSYSERVIFTIEPPPP